MTSEDQSASNSSKDDLFYSAVVTGWITTKLERDKSVLTLAAGGIGLVVTLLTTSGPSSISLFLLYVLSALSFIVSVVVVIVVLDRNGDHLEAVSKGQTEGEPHLALLDAVSFWSFVAGATLLALAGVFTGIGKLEQGKELQMANESQTPKSGQVEHRSLNGVGGLRPPASSGGTQGQQQPAQQPATDSGTSGDKQ